MKIEDVVKVVDNEIGPEGFKLGECQHRNQYHNEHMVTFKDKRKTGYGYGNVSFEGAPTGCGLMAMYGFYSLYDMATAKPYIKAIKKHFPILKSQGCGAIYATVGESHQKNNPTYKFMTTFLKELGFESLTEFNNYAHGKDYKQEIFIKKL